MIGLIRCGHCGCLLVGELMKGRYVYYHCTGYRGKCAEPYTREEALERQFAACLRKLVVPPAVLAWLQSEISASDQIERAAREQALRKCQTELHRIQARLDVLYEDRLDGRIDTATYDKKATEIREQQDRLLQKVRASEEAMLTPISEAVDLVALTSKSVGLFRKQTSAEKRRVLRLISEQASWKGEEVRISFQEPRVCVHNIDNWRGVVDTFRTLAVPDVFSGLIQNFLKL